MKDAAFVAESLPARVAHAVPRVAWRGVCAVTISFIRIIAGPVRSVLLLIMLGCALGFAGFAHDGSYRDAFGVVPVFLIALVCRIGLARLAAPQVRAVVIYKD